MTKITLISATNYSNRHWDLHVIVKPFLRKERKVTYRGSSTVFHDLKTGKRPGMLIQAELANILWLVQSSADVDIAKAGE